MKGEYVDTKSSETQNMFSKLHPHPHPHPLQHHPTHIQQQQQQQQQQNQHHHHLFSTPFQLTPRECQHQQASEEEETSSGTATATTTLSAQQRPKPTTEPNNPSGGDGATIEVVRRPRGRPPGSKNKPKPPVIITRESSEPAMSPYILEVPAGNDVVEAISRFCCRKNMGLCILTGSGTVANVTLRQPSTTPGATVTFHGRFDILSVSATFLPQTMPSSPAVPNGFTISLAGPQGQIVGGLVAGALMAAGTVYIVGASFNNPSYHRLTAEDELGRVGDTRSGDVHSPPLSGGGESGAHAPPQSQSCGMSMYNSCHLPTDVIWAPTPRQPQPPPY